MQPWWIDTVSEDDGVSGKSAPLGKKYLTRYAMSLIFLPGA